MDGKYKFEADWNYFILNQAEPGESSDLEKAYSLNDKDYHIRKEFFLRNNMIYPYSSFRDDLISAEAYLSNVPKKLNGEVLTYIGSLTGYYFQAFGADNVFLFYDKELGKAVVCFEYT